MSTISQAKFNVTYSGQCGDECEEGCQCENTYEVVLGINALEVLEMSIDDDFYIDTILCEGQGLRGYSVQEIARMVGHIVSHLNRRTP